MSPPTPDPCRPQKRGTGSPTKGGRGVSRLPRLVVLAAVVAGFDLADLFCYEVTEKSIVLISNKKGGSVRVSRAEAEAALRQAQDVAGEAAGSLGQPPEDTRLQAAPGAAEAGPDETQDFAPVPGPCDEGG